MKDNIEEIDKLIKETLSKEEAKFYDGLQEQNLFGMIGGLYKGKNVWLTIVMHLISVVAFGLLIYCLIQTFDVENTNDLILWIAGFFFSFIVMSMLKIFAWMQMHKNATLREMKRLELLITANQKP
ncbi:hypothetical protein FDT66_04125 [Polaribacter aestuariivivens]|uniref:Uncharacterized protein n=1 Tax=Polaribacter aestuariivivens TaxID=2304626 RepID=A0A5S3N788_9FLAO|nr:DUF6768 family protein [Polaribacter aestuariivivens]TMM31163.1 hypothetical protein FDT66_04125 [Polaribacter aestuariivivens]